MNHSRIFEKPEVLYEDESLLIVNKEAEELTVPGRGEDKQHCLMSRTFSYFGEVFNVHRLDQPTTGLVIIARTKDMQSKLSALFRDKKIEKGYIALVDGVLKEDFGIIDIPIRGDIENRPVQIVDRKYGKKAVTRWKVLKRNHDKTRVLLEPETGRTHQLRVHMRSLGHPIEGDRLYNDMCSESVYGELKLHAMSVKFIHPETGKWLFIVSEPRF